MLFYTCMVSGLLLTRITHLRGQVCVFDFTGTTIGEVVYIPKQRDCCPISILGGSVEGLSFD
jgi:hypothetical protein